jgi:ATP-dependent RNA helicase DeaD
VHRIGRTGRAGREGTAITLVEPREHRLLRSMEAVTKQKVEVATLPTVADLRARRLDLTRASLRERLLAGGLDHARVVVETLAQEFDIIDVAAAAVQMAHSALGGDGDDKEIPAASTHPPKDRESAGPRGSGPRLLKPARGRLPREAAAGENTTRLFVGAGRRAGIRPGDLVGAITGEAGIDSREIGAIEISDGFSLVEVPESRAQEIIAALKATKLRGVKVIVRRERDR